MTHKAKECTSRPRKLGARWTGRDIAADEVIQDVQLSWDGKRDRWNGYDAREHIAVVEEHKRIEEMRKAIKGEAEEEGDDADVKYAEESEMPGQGFDAENRISTRNLRIREDTAKYLVNLDLDSARYDPKTRTMVDKGATSDAAAAMVEEENFVRSSGDAEEFERLQRVAWESQQRGDRTKLHLQANPTEAEHLRRKQEAEAKEKKEKKQKELLEKYGGAEYLNKEEPMLEEQEVYVEYDERGQVKGKEIQKRKSKYAEDKLIGNHTSVWGSWWENFKWGYACCHGTTKNSYCTGEDGIKASEEAKRMRLGLAAPVEKKPVEVNEHIPDFIAKKPSYLEESEASKAKKEREEQEKKEKEDKDKKKEGDGDAGKRKLKHMLGGVTEEEMEEYRRQKSRYDDPMAKLADQAV